MHSSLKGEEQGFSIFCRDKALLPSRADEALYQAKKQGRNRVVVWRQE